jgi:hypothetical protein
MEFSGVVDRPQPHSFTKSQMDLGHQEESFCIQSTRQRLPHGDTRGGIERVVTSTAWLSPATAVQIVPVPPPSRWVDLLAEVYFRSAAPGPLGAAQQSIHFGTAGTRTGSHAPGCNAPGMAGFQLNLPGNLVFHGDPILNQAASPAVVVNGIIIGIET